MGSRPLRMKVRWSCYAPGWIDTCAPRIPPRPQIVQEVDEAAVTWATRRCWSLLFLRRWREQRRSFPGGGPGGESSVSVCFCSVPTFSKEEQFPFPLGSQVHGMTVCDALLPHSHPRPILPVASRVWFGDDILPHAPLAWDPGSSVRMPQNALPSVPSTPTPFRCTTTGMSIVPLETLAQLSGSVAYVPSQSRWLTRTFDLARDSSPSSTAFSRRQWQSGTPLCLTRDCCPLAKDAIEPVPPAEMRQGFYSTYFIVPKKGGGLWPILDLRVSNRALHKLPFKMLTHRRMIKCIQPQDWFQRSTWRTLTFTFRSFRDTDRSYGLRSKVGHGSTGSSPSGYPCLPMCSQRS